MNYSTPTSNKHYPLALRKTAMAIYDPIAAHEQVRDRCLACRHALVGPGRKMGHTLRNPHNGVVNNLSVERYQRPSRGGDDRKDN